MRLGGGEMKCAPIGNRVIGSHFKREGVGTKILAGLDGVGQRVRYRATPSSRNAPKNKTQNRTSRVVNVLR